MLPAFAQLQGHTPAFLAHIRRNRRIAVRARVGARYAFLPGPAVVLGEHVDVHRYQPAGQRGDGGARLFEEPDRPAICQQDKLVGLGIQLHAQGGGRRYRGKPQCLGEETVLAVVLDGIEVRLAGAQQSHIGRDDFPDAQPAALGDGCIQCLADLGEFRQGQTHQRKPGVVGKQFVALLELKGGKRVARRVEDILSHGTHWVKLGKPDYAKYINLLLVVSPSQAADSGTR